MGLVSELYNIFTTVTCPRCRELKIFFDKHGLEYEEKDLTDPENIIYLRVRGVFGMTAPILEDTVKNKFYLDYEIEDLMKSVR
jgi:hypothetical protein